MDRTDSPLLERHPHLYFSDGDVVLCATKANGAVQAFRVDRVYLTRNSPVLREMLSPASAASTLTEHFDGAPVLRLNDDASELASLLELLYNTVTVSLQRLDPNNPLRAMGILRLATKYAMEPLRALILRCIQDDWPQTLQEWDQLQNAVANAREFRAHSASGSSGSPGSSSSSASGSKAIARMRTTAPPSEPSQSPGASASSSPMGAAAADADAAPALAGPYIDDTFPEPASAIRLATDFGVPSVLPAAFYQLSITDPSADWDEYRAGGACADDDADDDAGMMDLDAWEHQCALATGTRTARWALLDRANLMRFLRGRTQLDAWLGDIEDCLTSYLGTAECVDVFHCDRVRHACRTQFLLEGPGRARPFDPLGALRHLVDVVAHTQLCGACMRHVRGELLRVRQEIWDEIPTMFGIAQCMGGKAAS